MLGATVAEVADIKAILESFPLCSVTISKFASLFSRPTVALEVLIVEDEMLLAMDMKAMIEDSRRRILIEAVCLKDVEALPDDVNRQLAFIDLHLADDSDGLDVSHVIQKRWPDALIVFVTANVARIPPDFAGAHGVIAKPFSHSGVVNAIKYLADGVFDPPPSMPRPASFTPSPNIERRWAAA